MNLSFIKVLCISVSLGLLLMPVNTNAYQYWSDSVGTTGKCASCHLGFRETNDYFSNAEGIQWGTSLHKAHLDNTDIETSCSNCHNGVSTSGNQVRINSSGAARDGVNFIGCMGCHGRLEDANVVTEEGDGWGAGLRQHHFGSSNAEAAAACGGCHEDADPENFTTAPESTMPPFYASVTNTSISLVMNPCSPDGEEDFSSNGTGLDNDGDSAYDGADAACAGVVPTPGDINFDGKADILWRNTASGQNWAYLMNGAAIDSSVGINTVADQALQIVGNGDYNGDGNADILWRSTSSGQNWMYLMNGSTIETSVGVGTVASQDWQVVGNGDYNGDGNADILWRNSVSGQNWMYLMDGATVSSSVGVNTVPPSWAIVGSGDHDGDGKADILLRNGSTGQNWMYLMDGATVSSSVGVNTVPTGWAVVGSGDYDGDGKADILWRNGSTGQNWMHLMNGALIASSVGVATVADTNWQVAGDGDYDADGSADILWRNSATGQNWMYLMNGASISSSESVNTVAAGSWQIVNVD